MEMEFISYKKLLIFGVEKAGKTSLSKAFDTTIFEEDIDIEVNEEGPKNSKIIKIIYFLNIKINRY